MIILLTGGTGLVGNSLGQALVREGHQLRVLVRDATTAMPHYPCQTFTWDPSQPAPFKALRDVDVVIHLAGENVASERWTEARKIKLQQSRLQTAASLASGIKQNNIKLKLYISASAVGYYGDRGDENLNEASVPGQDFLAKLSVAWENSALDVPAARTVQARIGIVLSPQGGFLRQVLPIFQCWGASRLGTGRQWMSWIHLKDLVHAFLRIIDDETIVGPINLVSPQPETNQTVTAAIAEVSGAFAGPPVPAAALKIMYGELSGALLGSQRVQPKVLQAHGFVWAFPDILSALRECLPDLKTGEMRLVFESWLDSPLKKVWPFFADEENLQQITPPFLNFRVLSKNSGRLGLGSEINYKLSLHGLPVRWRSRIAQWQVEASFVDEQIKGPYQKWHHLHQFETLGDGTLMRDTVTLKAPLGWLGRAVALPFVLNTVEAIFAFRNLTTRRLFARR